MNLLLVDDNAIFGFGFAHAMMRAEPSIRALVAETLDQGLAMAHEHPDLDIVLIDHHLVAENGLEGLRRFGLLHPQIARMLISDNKTPTLLSAARAAGATGFMGKWEAVPAMLARMNAVARGDLAFGTFPRHTVREVDDERVPAPTVRQREVLTLLAVGQPNKRIAAMLGIAERTVKGHITALLTHFGARNRTHLLVVARERGQI